MSVPETEGAGPTFFGAYGEWIQTALPPREDIAWLRDEWGRAGSCSRA